VLALQGRLLLGDISELIETTSETSRNTPLNSVISSSDGSGAGSKGTSPSPVTRWPTGPSARKTATSRAAVTVSRPPSSSSHRRSRAHGPRLTATTGSPSAAGRESTTPTLALARAHHG
jgi:hypothetical protein